MDRNTMSMNRRPVKVSRLDDSASSPAEDGSTGRGGSLPASAVALTPVTGNPVHEWNGLCTIPGRSTAHLCRRPVAMRKSSGNRQRPAKGLAGRIGSLARGVGQPSRAARRTGGRRDRAGRPA